MGALRTLAMLLVAPLLGVLVHPAAAQITEKQAVAQVKAASKAQIKVFKQNGAAALATMDATLTTIEGLLTSSTSVNIFANQVASAAVTFVSTMNTDYLGALDLPPTDAALALQSLANGGDLNGLYPKDFYFGTGGVLDAHRKAMLAAATKVRDAALKRLAKTAAKAEKVAGIGLITELELPTIVDADAVNQNNLLGFGERSRFDMILTASKLATANDGVMFVAGATDNLNVDVTLGYDGPDGAFASDSVTPDASSGRFADVFSGLAEGGYGTWAVQGGGNDYDAVGEIGIR